MEKRNFSVLEKETRTFDVNVLAEIYQKKILEEEKKDYVLACIDLQFQDEEKYIFRDYLIEYDQLTHMPFFNSSKEVDKYLDNDDILVLRKFDLYSRGINNKAEFINAWNAMYEKTKSITIDFNSLNKYNILFTRFPYLISVVKDVIYNRREELLDNSYYLTIEESQYNSLKYDYVSYNGKGKLMVIDIDHYENVKKRIFDSQYFLLNKNKENILEK